VQLLGHKRKRRKALILHDCFHQRVIVDLRRSQRFRRVVGFEEGGILLCVAVNE